MVELDLHISSRLRKLLPGLTDEEKAQLKANIEADGEIQDPILYWNDGTKAVIVDGMHRYPIAKKTGLPFRSQPVKIDGGYEDAELWILNHQLGRRNLLSPQAQRKLRGELYNRLKRKDGGHGEHIPQSERPECQIDTPVSTDGGNAAKKVAEKAGVSESTVKRDGARVEALKHCTPAVQKGVETGAINLTNAEIKTLGKFHPEHQNLIASDLRKGTAKNVEDARQKRKIKAPGTPKKLSGLDYGKCPVCAGEKWTKGDEGVICAKCQHPHGEPAGDPDEDRLKTQRQKTSKTCESLMRAFDDLQLMHARTCKACQMTEAESTDVIRCCKRLLEEAKGWT